MHFSCNKLMSSVLWERCRTSSVQLLTGVAKDALQRKGEEEGC